MKLFYKNLLPLVLAFAAVPAVCQNALQSKVQRGVSQNQLVHAARVQLDFEWKKQEYLERRVRFHPGKKIRVPYPAEYKSTRCAGVLLNTSRVATPSSCASYGDGFKLEKVTLTFSNGNKAVGTAQSVQIGGDIAQIAVAPGVTSGITGLQVSPVAGKQSLQDVYGSEVATGLQQFLIGRGVVSPRASRLSGGKASLEKGEPFVWKGKLVALVNRVPKRLPVSLFGQISEDFLSLFR